MKIAAYLAVQLCLGILGCHGLECPKNGWSQADDICYRIVHFPESYWSAYHHCKAVGGNLLQLKNAKKVKAAVGQTMEGNADDFRIDGYASGKWYQRESENLVHDDYEFLTSLNDKTLTLNLQDGRVSGDTDLEKRIGFICQGGEDLTKPCDQKNSKKTSTDDSANTNGNGEGSPVQSPSNNEAPSNDDQTAGVGENVKVVATTTTMATTTTTESTTYKPLNKTEANSLLIKASVEKSMDKLKHALSQGADTEAAYRPGQQTPLHRLVRLFRDGDGPAVLPMVKLLLDHGANPNYTRGSLYIPVLTAALNWKNETGDLIKLLLRYNASTTQKSPSDPTKVLSALEHVARRSCDPELLELMVKKGGADVNSMATGSPPLLYAIGSFYLTEDCQLKVVKTLVALGADPAIRSAGSSTGKTALAVAVDKVYHNTLLVANYLAGMGYNLTESEATSLFRIGMQYFQEDKLEFAVKQGVDPDTGLNFKSPPLYYTIKSRMNRFALTKTLLDCGANPNISSTFPLLVTRLWSNFNDSEPMLMLLLNHSADATGKDGDDMTALHNVVRNSDDAELYELLLRRGGADVDAMSKKGTPLRFAVESKHKVEALLKLNADPNIPCSKYHYQCKLPLHLAVEQGKLEVVKLLVEMGGADFETVKDRNGKSAKQLAVELGKTEIVDYFNTKSG